MDQDTEDTEGFEHLRVAEAPDAPSAADHKYEVDEGVGATAFGYNVYEADAGQRLPWGRHEHPDHEELFHVLAGSLAVETPAGDYRVGTGEALFVPPGHPQRAVAAADGTRVVAVGAPKGSDGAVLSEPCPACGEATDRDHEAVDGGDTYVLYCADCGAETDRLDSGVDGDAR